ncbi:hypothetical protein ACLKA7_001948 [Drosophila subpalustris]
MQNLLQREQQASEGVDDYIHHMRQLASSFLKLLRDRDQVKIIKRGLKKSVASIDTTFEALRSPALYKLQLAATNNASDVTSSIELEKKSRAYTAFWQIKLKEKSRAYTAFTVPERPLYQFRHMLVGLCNAAHQLCRLMDKVIERLRLLGRPVDNFRRIPNAHEVWRVFEKANLTIGMVKSKFCFRTLNYLGYIIGGGTLRMDPGRVEGIKKIPTPRNTKELRRFLGTAEWYRRVITADGSRRYRSSTVPAGRRATGEADRIFLGTVTEKECLSAKLAIHRFRQYV